MRKDIQFKRPSAWDGHTPEQKATRLSVLKDIVSAMRDESTRLHMEAERGWISLESVGSWEQGQALASYANSMVEWSEPWMA
jgi:hypothetical protein